MATSTLVITNAGLAAVAGLSGTEKVTITEIACGYVTNGGISMGVSYTYEQVKAFFAETTSMEGEIKRIPVIAQSIDAGTNVLHLTCSDTSADAYTCNELGVYTSDGVLFAYTAQFIGSQKVGSELFQKASQSHALLAIDLALTNVDPDSITVGDTNFQFNDASETEKGIIELATEAEAKAGVDATRAITPKTLQSVIQKHSNVVHIQGDETIVGKKTFADEIIKEGTLARNTAPNSFIGMVSNKTSDTGGGIWLYADGHMTYAGCFLLRAAIQGKYKELIGKQDGVLVWDGKNIVRSVNGTNADGAGNVVLLTFPNTVTVKKGDLVLTEGGVKKNGKTDALDICSGTSYEDSPTLSLYPTEYTVDSEMAGRAVLRVGENEYHLVLTPDGKMLWDGTTFQLGKNTKINFQTNEKQLIFVDANGDLIFGDTNGAMVRICDMKSGINPGGFQLRSKAADGTLLYLVGKPDGSLMWNDKKVTLAGDCVPVTGGTFTGAIKAPTPSASSNDTTVPTTAWVRGYAAKSLVPNYTSGTDVTSTAATSSGYTVASGYGFVRFYTATDTANGTYKAYVNGELVYENLFSTNSINGGNDKGGSVVFLPVCVGDKITTSSSNVKVKVYKPRS